MTLAKTPATVQFAVDAPPAGGLEEAKIWMVNMFNRLVELQQQPRVQRIMFSHIEASMPADAAVTKPADGMFIWAAADVVGAGAAAGLYLYEGGIWKRVQTV
jgi:hypothetical protein